MHSEGAKSPQRRTNMATKSSKSTFSGKTAHVSDGDVMRKSAVCPECRCRVSISIPDRKWHGNTAKFGNHAASTEEQA